MLLRTAVTLLAAISLVEADNALDKRLVSEIISGKRSKYMIGHLPSRLLVLIYPVNSTESTFFFKDTYIFDVAPEALDITSKRLSLYNAVRLYDKWPRFGELLVKNTDDTFLIMVTTIHDHLNEYLLHGKITRNPNIVEFKIDFTLFNLKTAQLQPTKAHSVVPDVLGSMFSSSTNNSFFFSSSGKDQLNELKFASPGQRPLPETLQIDEHKRFYICRDGPVRLTIETLQCTTDGDPPPFMTGLFTTSVVLLFDDKANVYISDGPFLGNDSRHLVPQPIAHFFIVQRPSMPILTVLLLVTIGIVGVSVGGIIWYRRQKQKSLLLTKETTLSSSGLRRPSKRPSKQYTGSIQSNRKTQRYSTSPQGNRNSGNYSSNRTLSSPGGSKQKMWHQMKKQYKLPKKI